MIRARSSERFMLSSVEDSMWIEAEVAPSSCPFAWMADMSGNGIGGSDAGVGTGPPIGIGCCTKGME